MFHSSAKCDCHFDNAPLNCRVRDLYQATIGVSMSGSAATAKKETRKPIVRKKTYWWPFFVPVIESLENWLTKVILLSSFCFGANTSFGLLRLEHFVFKGTFCQLGSGSREAPLETAVISSHL